MPTAGPWNLRGMSCNFELWHSGTTFRVARKAITKYQQIGLSKTEVLRHAQVLLTEYTIYYSANLTL